MTPKSTHDPPSPQISKNCHRIRSNGQPLGPREAGDAANQNSQQVTIPSLGRSESAGKKQPWHFPEKTPLQKIGDPSAIQPHRRDKLCEAPIVGTRQSVTGLILCQFTSLMLSPRLCHSTCDRLTFLVDFLKCTHPNCPEDFRGNLSLCGTPLACDLGATACPRPLLGAGVSMRGPDSKSRVGFALASPPLNPLPRKSCLPIWS